MSECTLSGYPASTPPLHPLLKLLPEKHKQADTVREMHKHSLFMMN